MLPSPYHKPAFERIDETKRNSILEIGIDEFANKGFDKANINVIARRADVSVGSLYKYFNTKEDLFLTCVYHGIGRTEEVLQEVTSSDEDLLQKVEHVVRAIQKFSRLQRNYFKLYNEMTSENKSELVWKLASGMESVSAKIYTEAIEQAQKEGSVRGDFDPKLFAFFLDNLFTTLQFSYSCEYYRERFKIYTDKDILEQDDFVVEELLKFIKAAFS